MTWHFFPQWSCQQFVLQMSSNAWKCFLGDLKRLVNCSRWLVFRDRNNNWPEQITRKHPGWNFRLRIFLSLQEFIKFEFWFCTKWVTSQKVQIFGVGYDERFLGWVLDWDIRKVFNWTQSKQNEVHIIWLHLGAFYKFWKKWNVTVTKTHNDWNTQQLEHMVAGT